MCEYVCYAELNESEWPQFGYQVKDGWHFSVKRNATIICLQYVCLHSSSKRSFKTSLLLNFYTMQ